jgi:putative transposase
MRNPFRYFNSSPEVIRLTVMMYIRYPLSLRQVEDILFERGIDICHETVRYWWNRFGPMLANEIRKRRLHHRSFSQWRWHLDEVFVRINGETHYLWRAVDHEGEVLEVFATKRRDRRAALKFLKRTMKRYGRPRSIVTDRLRSYRSAMKVIGNAADQECGRWLNNRAENSHQPFRRRERAMQTFRAVICSHPRINPQPLQPRPSPQPPRHLQTEPLCRPGRVASTRGLNASDQHPSQGRSGLSDNARRRPPFIEGG